MTAELLRQHLERRGLDLLAVTRHHCDPTVLVVYLNGMAGQDRDGVARALIASVPGVLRVTDSVPAPTIILVQLAHDSANR